MPSEALFGIKIGGFQAWKGYIKGALTPQRAMDVPAGSLWHKSASALTLSGEPCSAYRNKFQADTRIEDQFITKYSRDICVATRGNLSEYCNKALHQPSFAEFVRYLIKTQVEQHDEHWQLVTLRCR